MTAESRKSRGKQNKERWMTEESRRERRKQKRKVR
jgi:hypothetical protein